MNISNLLTGIGIALTIIITVWRVRVKYIAFEIITNSPLIPVQKDIPKEIEIHYKGNIVNNVYLLVLKIENIGNVNITKEDFDENITISFTNQIRALFGEKIESKPENLDIKVEILDNKIQIHPLLFNKQESFTIKCLLEGDGGKIKVHTRIEGITEVLTKGEQPIEFNILRVISAILVILVGFLWNSYSKINFNDFWIYLIILISWYFVYQGFLYILGLKS